jgi:hypothetical protein
MRGNELRSSGIRMILFQYRTSLSYRITGFDCPVGICGLSYSMILLPRILIIGLRRNRVTWPESILLILGAKSKDDIEFNKRLDTCMDIFFLEHG